MTAPEERHDMPTLTEAQAAADAAHATYAEAVTAATAARQASTDLRERLRTGRGADVTSDDLARADAAADHADLTVEGARCGLADLQEAVQTARRDALCDELVTTLPRLGATVTDALDALSEAVATYVGRVQDYNAFAGDAVLRLESAGAAGARVSLPRHGSPTVDRISIARLHGDRLLMAELLPALRDLGAPTFLLTEAQTVAGSAAAIPTA
jgi:hypothetical protein